MATTKIWAVTDSLKRVVDYARNPDKTEIGDDLWAVIHYASSGRKATRYDEACAFVTGVACSSEHAYEEMVEVKMRFGKAGGKQAYHAYQSFKPGEVTPQQCHEIGVDLARRLWGSRYQVLVCTHLDRSHYHNHFVINSVSYTDGKRFDCSQRTYYEFRRVSDELCKGRGYPSLITRKGIPQGRCTLRKRPENPPATI
ncbi:MAG: relaxase/mobilization nuclease domain-containing protein [Firmicutes bacterium]|nr:relaxase/mobilization nuclease domain-containing protein [Bacillota bacterium]